MGKNKAKSKQNKSKKNKDVFKVADHKVSKAKAKNKVLSTNLKQVCSSFKKTKTKTVH